MRSWIKGLFAASALAATSAATADADAFCGFYVSGADAQLFNNATLVVMMRDGTRTVLSMQNNYEGPPENFAMVVPVPVVLQKDNVKTLPPEIFKRVDQLTAPRLVEYWEQDPCEMREREDTLKRAEARPPSPLSSSSPGGGHGVKIEAQFTVGEYEIVILSAEDSSGLDRWLRENSYKIPAGAEPALRPYVEQGMKFFVAKVDATKVTFVPSPKGGKMASLSPLRFHYDTDSFALPVRLGLLNSGGTQDLIVNILAPGTRYEVANFKNVTIPTNLDVKEGARKEFGAFYAALFDKTLETNPGAVVTEYSWDAGSCDPCPTPALNQSELVSLGADVIGGGGTMEPRVTIGSLKADGGLPAPRVEGEVQAISASLTTCYQRAREMDASLTGSVTIEIEVGERGDVKKAGRTGTTSLPETMLTCLQGSFTSGRFPTLAPADPKKPTKLEVPITFDTMAAAPSPIGSNFVLTRLHARYGKESLGQDLVFQKAEPIFGGREVRGMGGRLEQGSVKGGMNNFQGRYAIRHPWTGDVKCKDPVRGVWGGPPRGETYRPPEAAMDLAFAPRGKAELASFLQQDVPELKIGGIGTGVGVGSKASTQEADEKDEGSGASRKTKSSCWCGVVAGDDDAGMSAMLAAGAIALGLSWRRRARARRS